MDKIAIVTPAREKLGTFLKHNINNIEIIEIADVYELQERLELAPLRVDTLLIMDEGMTDTRQGISSIRDAGVALMNSLSNPYFKLDRLIYLNKTENSQHRDIMTFIKEDKGYNFKLNIKTSNTFQAALIKEILLDSDLDMEGLELKYSYVIKTKKGKSVDSKFLEEFQTDKALLLEHPIANTNKDRIKEQLSGIYGDSILKDEMVEELSPLDDLNQPKEIAWIDKPQNTEKKIIGFVGQGKSGTSTAALMAAMSGSEFDKTLVIDMNWDNLGLSYIMEKTLEESDYHKLDLSQLVNTEDKAAYISTELLNRKKLHAITLSLPVKKIIDKDVLSLVIANIIELVEKRYRFIIIDIPMQDVIRYSEVVNKLNRMIVTTPPYMNNVIAMLTGMTSLEKTKLFDSIDSDRTLRDIICLQTNVFRVNNKIKPIAIETFNKYADSLINRKMKRTGVYVYRLGDYRHPVLFQQLVEL